MSADVAQDTPQQSSVDIVRETVQQEEAAASAAEAPVESAAPAEPAQTPQEVKLSQAAEFLMKQGHKIRKDDGRDNWMPLKTVESMLDRYMGEHRQTWDGRYSTLEAEHKTLKEFRDGFAQALKGDPHAFMQELAGHDKRYAAFLQQQAVEAKAEAAGDPKPEADIDLGNGMKTYSPSQNEKYIEWKARQIVQEALKPYEDERKQTKEQAAKAEREERDRQQARAHMAAVESEPDWLQHKDAVQKLLSEDSEQAKTSGQFQIRTIREALLIARNQYLSADDAAKRQRWIQESNSAPKSTAVARPGVERTAKPGPRPSKDIVRETIERLERGGQ